MHTVVHYVEKAKKSGEGWIRTNEGLANGFTVRPC